MKMDGCEPKFLPQWLKGTVGEKRIGASSNHDPSAASKINRAESFLNKTERVSTNKSWKSGPGNTRKNHLHCEGDGFSNLHDYGSFHRSYSEQLREAGGQNKEPENEGRWDAIFSNRMSGTQMNFTSHDNRTSNCYGTSRRCSASPLGNRTENNSLLRRSRSFASDAGSEDSSGKPQILKSMHRASFDRDFPILCADARNGAVDLGPRGISLCTSSRLICKGYESSSIRPDWKSALAEPPFLDLVAPAETHSNPCLSSQNAGTNMLGALMQKSDREDSQSQVEPNKMEEMALKKSRQLIPATPSMPKGMHGIGYRDRAKGKSSSLVNMGATQAAKPAHSNVLNSYSSTQGGGRLLVLKTAEDHLVSAQKFPSPDRLITGNNLNSGNTGVTDKRPNTASALYSEQKKPTRQSIKERNEFFNSLRQKGATEDTSPKNCLSLPETPSTTKLVDRCDENSTNGSKEKDEALEGPVLPEAVNNEDNGVGFNSIVEKTVSTVISHCESESSCVIPEEEEAFLRCLGWDEGAGGDEALTEEEINSFILQHMQAVLSKNMLRGKSAWKLSALRMHEMMHVGNVGSVSSD